MTVTLRDYGMMVLCYGLGLWALLDTGNPFGAFALVFVPALCLLLTYGLMRGWIKVAWV